MHVKTWLGAASCAVALTGCFGSTDKDKDGVAGTTTTMAAEALTKAASFTGGKLVDGLMPKGDTSDVSLLPSDNESIAPGDSSLMGFDINPGDASITSALIQFKGSSGHFQIKASAFMTDAADGGVGDGGTDSSHVELKYMIDDSVCEKLCDQKYDIEVTQALKLENGDVTEHAIGHVTLDCSDKGDHSLCATEKGDDGTSGSGADEATSKLVKSYYKLQTSLCECPELGIKECPDDQGQIDCTIDVFDKHESEIKDKYKCIQDYIDAQQACIDKAECNPTALSKCDFLTVMMSDGDAIAEACGALPDAIDSETELCHATMKCNDSGKAVAPSSICDGVDDCKDGSDEMNCGGEVIDNFSCGADQPIVTIDQLCDGKMDCPDNNDETVNSSENPTGLCISCGTDGNEVYSVYDRCDGKMKCSDGADEVGCQVPCADGEKMISVKDFCNGKQDCADNSDESSCSGTGMLPCGDGTSVPIESLCNGTMECANGFDEMACAVDAGMPGK